MAGFLSAQLLRHELGRLRQRVGEAFGVFAARLRKVGSPAA